MTDILKREISTICIVHIIAIIIAIIFFMIFYMKAKKDATLKAFLVMQISIILWMIFKIFKTVSPTEDIRWWFILGYYLCTCIFEVAFLEFSYSNYYGKRIKKNIRYLLYAIAFFQFLWIFTNPRHFLFYSTYDMWGDSFGILFYFHTLIEYTFILVGFIYGCKKFKLYFSKKNKWYKLLIASTIILPLILNFLYITKVIHRFIFSLGVDIIFDITPIVFVFSTLVFVYATFNHDFIELSPLLKYEVVHRLDTPVCVINNDYDIIYINEKVNELLNKYEISDIYQFEKSFQINEVIQNINSEITIDDLCVEVKLLDISSKLKSRYLLILRNITDLRNIQNKICSENSELNNANEVLNYTIERLKETSRIGARNYVARELHDIIGHSLVVTIKLLEVARMYYNIDSNLSEQALLDSLYSLENGVKNMNTININKNYSGLALKNEILKMFDRMKNTSIKCKLKFIGEEFDLDEKTYDVISRVCRELATNSIKHGQAEKIYIFININENKIAIRCIDDGIGCENIILGNGLIGIKSRLDEINGKVDFSSSKNEGFMSIIEIIRK